MLKKLAALLLSAIISVSAVTVTVSAQELQTAAITREAEASYTKWNGKTTMQAGKNYIVTSDVTISKKVTVPAGTTLVVQKGAKLWINTKGALYIKGKLNVKAGGVLAVSGTLYQYKSKSLAVYGEMRFGSKSKVTLNGKVSIYSKGKVTGTPKTLSVGSAAAFTCAGENSCAKLDKYIDRTAIEKQLEAAFALAVKDNDIYGAVNTLLCKEHIAAIDSAFASAGTTLKAYCDEYADTYMTELKNEGISSASVKSVDVKATKLTEKKTLTGDIKTIADTYYNGGKVYEVSCTVTVKTSTDTYAEKTVLFMAEKDGAWYMLGE